jgi:hypothetical protein
MIQLFGPFNSGAAVGGDGVATANATTTHPLFGEVLAVYVKYNDSPPAGTTDVIVATAGSASAPPALAFLTLTDGATDGYRYPRAAVHDLAGAGVTFDGTNEIYEPVAIADKVKVTIAQANAADNADVWLLMRC